MESPTNAYRSGKLLVSIVEKNKGEQLVKATKNSGARGGTILLGLGTTGPRLLHLLCLDEAQKDIVLTLLSEDEVEPVVSAVKTLYHTKNRRIGISLLVDASCILHHLVSAEQTFSFATRRSSMETLHTLIVCIVNEGAAESIMDACRQAGAPGGTVLTGRGTGTEEDVKFFGVSLVPQKEILLIAVESEKVPAILSVIQRVPSIATPGSGIAFCIGVEQFIPLGKE